MTNQILEEKYEIQKELGNNPGRKTLLAKDLETQELVVIKILQFGAEFALLVQIVLGLAISLL
ncbi:MAG: hypothetical protein AAFY21_13755, partial [Cyanobacteria bacterium J06641_2]